MDFTCNFYSNNYIYITIYCISTKLTAHVKPIKKQNILIVLFWECHFVDWFWITYHSSKLDGS